MRNLEPGDPPDVGGYPLLARLGAGGMGQVFLSRTPSGRPLALKTVRDEYGDDPDFARRFAREIASSDRVRSPWTVAVVDFSPPERRPQWLATEYVAAPSLAEWVERHGPLPEPALRSLAAELAEALRAVHRAGLTHRDVKPSNVLLARHHPRLIDFGIARAADDTRHTRTGGVIGSPGYMAPEQITSGLCDEPGDIFALGAVLVYAATGRGPFLHPGEEPSAGPLLYRVVHEDPGLDGVPPSLVPLLRACLDKTPTARPTADRVVELAGDGGWTASRPARLETELVEREEELAAALARAASAHAPEPTTSAQTGAQTGAPAGGSAAGSAGGAAPTGTPGGPTPVGGLAPGGGPASAGGVVPADGPVPAGGPVPASGPLPASGVAAAGGVASAGSGGGFASVSPPSGFGPAVALPGPTPVPTGAGVPPLVPPRPLDHTRATRPRALGLTAGLAGCALAVAAVVALVVKWPGGTADKGGDRTGGPSPTATAAALPSSWTGTWEGRGPGSSAAGTSEVTVTLTLHPAARGELVGRQVSRITVAGTGRDIGCTETLRLREVHRDSMVFEAATSTPTDPSLVALCVRGNLYTLTRTGPDTLALGDEGSQAPGSPTRFDRS
ncbi:serine/threonine protein kinase [Streptomyces sp. 5-8]|uniref:Serine/threonine protein kinase n=1 Tax=Streptomyces musisoli TaxID=2802280 RepID=A0ABS1P3Q9_9ACTN|nr:MULTISPECIES: serine/threonine-protein kinase [Streptomyces]MBL1106815.1 serine/threonine protein kinase [Streptomyces musisoli]MBY8842201.1 serine/threonine protein kinase [Streptomyces sp. SP2-10]